MVLAAPRFEVQKLPSEFPRRHLAHLSLDPKEADTTKESYNCLIRGEYNSFPVNVDYCHVKVLPPLEPLSSFESLSGIVSTARELGEFVHLVCFPAPSLKGSRVGCNGPLTLRLLHQTPLQVDEYERKLRRFQNAGYTWRALDKADIPQMKHVAQRWAERPLARTRSDAASYMTSIEDVLSSLDTLKVLGDSLRGLQRTGHGDDASYESLLDAPFGRTYGCFKDDTLLAYVHGAGTTDFFALEERHQIAQNSFSPQEFIDLVLFSQLAKEGTRVVCRGGTTGEGSPRPSAASLLVYKQKFGPIQEIEEQTWPYCYVPRNGRGAIRSSCISPFC